jgi:enoyl-CoA hydratase/carnithine racemase
VRGLGPRLIGAETAAVIDLVVRLVPAEELARVQEEAAEVIAGCTLPRIDVPARNVISAAQMLICWLGMPPFQAV